MADAAYRTAHGQPGGCEALAARMRVSAGVLRKKVDPNCDTNHLTLAESAQMMGLTGDLQVLHALAEELGQVCVPMPSEAGTCDMAVLEIVAKVWCGHGDVGQAVYDTLADGRVEAHELKRVRETVYAVTRNLMAMLSRLEAMAE